MTTTATSNNALVILTEFERRLAACTTLVEAKAMRDEAETLRHYCKTARVGLAAQNRCAVARALVEHRLGEMLAKLPRAPGPGRGKRVAADRESFLKRLEAEGIQYPDARRWQRMARIPEEDFRRGLEAWCSNGDGQHLELDAAQVDHLVDMWIQHYAPKNEKPLGELHWDTWDLKDERARDRLELLEESWDLLESAREKLVTLYQYHGADVREMITKLDALRADLDHRFEEIVHGGLSQDRGLLKLISAG
jgi:hypothetical protein